MREVTPKELQKLNDKSFKETQKIFRRRLREIAKEGNVNAEYKPKDYKCGEQIKPWLENLGFKVKEISPSWCKITWPEEENLIEKLRSECLPILNSTLPEAARNAVSRLTFTKEEGLGKWSADMTRYDFVCSKCGEHSEYKTDFCCNCGKKMMNDKEGRKYDT